MAKIFLDCKRFLRTAEDCKRFLRITKFERDWKKMISLKPANNNTIQQTKKRYLEGCACAGAALKIIRLESL